jgi:uncharacterized membrane protein YfcA
LQAVSGTRFGATTALGAVRGAFTLLSVPAGAMKQLLALLLLALLALLLLRPWVGVEAAPEISAPRRALGRLSFLPVGFWATNHRSSEPGAPGRCKSAANSLQFRLRHF